MSAPPIITSLLDTDFYKLLMLQLIWRFYPDVQADWQVLNRTASVNLSDEIDEDHLRHQLDHARELSFRDDELHWLETLKMENGRPIFQPDFLAWLGAYRLPPYRLSLGQRMFDLRFEGPWRETTLWEIPALSIIL